MIIQTTLICLTSGKSNQRWLYSGCLGSLLPGPQPLGIGWMLNIRYGQKLSPFWGKLSNIFIFYRPPYNHYQASSDLGWSCWCALRRWERQTQECPGVFDALPYLPFGSSTLSFNLSFLLIHLPKLPGLFGFRVFATERPWKQVDLC